MTLNELFFGLIAAAVVLLATFQIFLIVRLVDTVKAARIFLDEADKELKETAGDIRETLRSIRAVADNMGAVTSDVRSFSGSVRDVGSGVRQVTTNMRQIGELIDAFRTETVSSFCGLRAGLKTGFEVFLKNLLGAK